MAKPTPVPLTARFIYAIDEYAEIAVTNNLETPLTINKVFYVSKDAGSTVQGVIEDIGKVKPYEEIRFTVSIPSTNDPNLLSDNLKFYAETDGVSFVEQTIVYYKVEDRKRLRVRIIGVTGEDAEIGVTNTLQTPVIINQVFYVSKEAGTKVEGVKENPGIVKPNEEMRFTVSAPSTLEPNSLTIDFTFYAETHGVKFTEDVTVYNFWN